MESPASTPGLTTADRAGSADDPSGVDPFAAFEAIDQAARAITEVLDLETVLQLIVDRVRELVDARYAAIGIFGPDGRIERFNTSGISRDQRVAIGAVPEGHGLLGLIIHEGQTLRLDDIRAHPESRGFPEHHPPMRSLLGVPVLLSGRTIGDLYLTDKRGASGFSETDQRIVELFSRHAAIAIENARLHDRLAAMRVVTERERIGRDLHDGVIQRLYAIGLSLEDVESLIRERPDEAIDRVDHAIDGIHRSIADIREFILGLRPNLSGGDLASGLVALADELRRTSAVEVDVQIEPPELLDALDPSVTGELIHLVRESLSNVARHARATHVLIDARPAGDGIALVIADNGVGFDPVRIVPGRHHGLGNLRDRANAAGGRLEIDSRPGSGTRIIVHLSNSEARRT